MTSQLYDVATNNIAQAADLNQAVDALNILLGFTTSVSLAGATSGTAVLYQPLQGTVKMVIVAMNNFQNNSASGQTIALPSAFTRGTMGWNSGCGIFQLISAGTALSTVQIHTTPSTGTTDGSVSPQTNVRQNVAWHTDVPFDTIYFNGSDASSHNGYIFIVGS